MDEAGAVGFDPHTWLRPAPQPAPAPAAIVSPPATPRWPWLAGSGLCFAAAIGAGWIGRDKPQPATVASPAPVAAVASQPAVAPAAPASAVERTSGLADAAELRALLVGNGLAEADAAAIATVATPRLGAGPLTVTLSLRPGTPPTLLRLVALHQDSSGAIVTPAAAGGWHAEPIARAVKTQIIGGSAQITGDSLYSSAVAAGIDESLLPDFAKAFSYDIDFQADVGPGDTFEMAAEQGINAQGQPVGAPQLVFAQLTTQTKSLALYRFAPAGGAPGWYDANGRSVIRAFMRTPVDGARVSSAFGVRMHPVLDIMKMHEGVDFAVPLGTPIYAAADGVVLTAHLSVTAGNMVELKHDKGLMTRYFHMTRFADGIVPGVHVHQGQVIGLSGSTGRSTGPHLHYELRINGVAIDPLTYKTEDGHSLAGAELAAFRRERARIDTARAHQGA